MLGALMFFGFLLGAVAAGGILYALQPQRPDLALLAALGGGGLLGWLLGLLYWEAGVPPALKQALQAARTGILIVALGADKKVRLLPGRSDGFVVRPLPRPYSERYAWAADGESAYPVHGGKGMQAIITFMGYPFPLEVRKAAAISKFREKGFRSLEDLKLAVELPSPEEVEERLERLAQLRAQVERMSDEEVERLYGEGKERVLAEIAREEERLRRVKELVERYGGGPGLSVNVDGALVRASDLISYLVWRHHPAEVERIIKAETNAVLAKLRTLDWLRPWIPIIILVGIIVLGIIAALALAPKGGEEAAAQAATVIGQAAGGG